MYAILLPCLAVSLCRQGGKVNTIRTILAATSLPRNEIRMLLMQVLQRTQAWLVAHDDYVLTGHEDIQFSLLLARRAAGEPMAYVLGTREFYGRAFRCSPAALIPRPETELLVDIALQYLATDAPSAVLDAGTGTGCIAISVALERPRVAVIAIDISADALALAADNARRLSATLIFLESNWFTAVPVVAQFDLILSNPPYIMPGDSHLVQGDLRFEPAIALADTVDGLESYRQLTIGAKQHLRPGGMLIVEHGFDQGESVPALFRKTGFVDVVTQRDIAGHPRVTLCRKPPPH